MAPEAALAKRKPRENQYLFNLGVQGRKTGITVPDTGIRDENGMEDMNGLFSSPEKPKAMSVQKVNGINGHAAANGTITSEEDMDVDESTLPEPAAVLNERKQVNMRMPPPRSKSPIKTFLQSPARRNPSLGPASSPERPTGKPLSSTVRRKLDFANASFDSIEENTIQVPQKASAPALQSLGMAKLASNDGTKSLAPPFKNLNNAVVDSDDSIMSNEGFANEDDSLQLVNNDSEIMAAPAEDMTEDIEQVDGVQEESIVEPEPAPKVPKKGKEKAAVVEEVTAKAGKRGRPKKVVAAEPQEDTLPIQDEVESVEPKRPQKRTRTSLDSSASKLKGGKSQKAVEQADEEPEERPAKKKGGRPKKIIAQQQTEEAEEPTAKSKKAGKPRKLIEQQDDEPAAIADEEQEVDNRPSKKVRRSVEDDGSSKALEKPKKIAKAAPAKSKNIRKNKLDSIPETGSPVLQRGPPLPRTNNGLFILRRETPAAGAGFKQTRSGRNSIKPLAYWKNERIEYDEDEVANDKFGKYLMPSIKEVVRAEEVEPTRKPGSRKRGRSQAPRSRKATAEPESEDEDEIEPWEMEPGNVLAAIRAWDPEDPTGAEVGEIEDEVALSSAAIITRDIAGATFKFAKTLSYPFFGAGMVDLPPNSQKKPKNSRRMQMAFFVFYGRVKVTIHDTEFRIGKGGMFQVPRGNFYSIENDYDKPARIFFSQGCELPEAESQ